MIRVRPVVALAAALVAGLAFLGAARGPGTGPQALLSDDPPQTLQATGLFRDAAATMPAPGVTPYALNTALFSDGAVKQRFVYLPPGAVAAYRADDVFDFPVGAVLVKTFAFPLDLRAPDGPARRLETRLLVRRAGAWVALPYVWNAEGTEARLSPIGATLAVSYTDAAGAPSTLAWSAPNRNQCKGCHGLEGAVTPIGPKARNLNGDYPYADGRENQIAHWSRLGLLSGAPSPDVAPRVPTLRDETSPVALRARAYLDVNCAHCHRPGAAADTSGLDLSWSQTEPARYGVEKRPVAAGRGSASFEFDIAPGAPDKSILAHRLASTDPGVMMPELGRTLVDEEGLAVVRQWIAEMK
ncbi:MAG: SO2930 family diheme c-type cytochrome [Caulobacterales bacterium]